jgi:hypothetical protein
VLPAYLLDEKRGAAANLEGADREGAGELKPEWKDGAE